MLDPKVCQKCWVNSIQAKDVLRPLSVCCLLENRILLLTEVPPEKCPYVLEHALSAGVHHAEL